MHRTARAGSCIPGTATGETSPSGLQTYYLPSKIASLQLACLDCPGLNQSRKLLLAAFKKTKIRQN